MNLPAPTPPLRPADIRTALWVAFWLYILQAGEPSLLQTLINYIGGKIV